MTMVTYFCSFVIAVQCTAVFGCCRSVHIRNRPGCFPVFEGTLAFRAPVRSLLRILASDVHFGEEIRSASEEVSRRT